MRLIHTATAREIEPGAMVRHTDGTPWRYESVASHPTDGHRVHCTRVMPRVGRVHKHFHPSLLGCEVIVDVTWRRHAVHTAHHAWSKINEWLWAGALALLPLAFFEHFHWADYIAGWVGGH